MLVYGSQFPSFGSQQFELLAQSACMGIDGTGIQFRRSSPDRCQQVLSGKDPATIAKQEQRKLVLFLGELDGLIVHQNLSV